jgi:hypothetical protein
MPIIKTIPELTQYVEVGSLNSITSVMPSIRSAERQYLVPVLGEAQYQELVDAYNDPGTISDDEQQLLDLCQEAVANIAMAFAVTRLAVQLGDSGVRRSESDTQKTAFQYQEVNLRESLANAGFDTLEAILAFLETKKLVFTAWSNSPAYLDYKRYFIPSGVDFNRFYANKQSRLMYINIRFIMKRIEDFNVKDIIGQKLFAFLKAGQLAGNLDEKYQALLDNYICPGIALLTVAKGLFQRAVDLTENGVTVSSLGITKNSQERTAAPSEKMLAMINDLNLDGNEYLKRLGEELTANAANYDQYEAPTMRSSLMNIDNKQENGIYSV